MGLVVKSYEDLSRFSTPTSIDQCTVLASWSWQPREPLKHGWKLLTLCGRLWVITGSKWDYTFHKWGYNFYITYKYLKTCLSVHNCRGFYHTNQQLIKDSRLPCWIPYFSVTTRTVVF
jgi:hypothetical protein